MANENNPFDLIEQSRKENIEGARKMLDKLEILLREQQLLEVGQFKGRQEYLEQVVKAGKIAQAVLNMMEVISHLQGN